MDDQGYLEINRAYGRTLFSATVQLLVWGLLDAVSALALRVAVVIAWWQMPPVPGAFVVAFGAANVAFSVWQVRKQIRKRRWERGEGTDGQRAANAVEAAKRMRPDYEKPRGPRAARWSWEWCAELLFDAGFGYCLGVVLVAWGVNGIAALAVAGAFFGAREIVSRRACRAMKHSLDMVAFLDTTAPKDTPEI